MSGKRKVKVQINPKFAAQVLRSGPVEQACETTAEAALAVAKANAPVKTGAYRDGLTIVKVPHAYRDTYQVVGNDPKTLWLEMKTGNLKRAIKAASATGGK